MSNEEVKKDLDYYMNLDWTLIEGTDLDFNGNPYHYIEIKEIPSFVFCAKTREKALENYKNKFVEKYGYLTNVPLLQVFDDNFGIGSPFAKMKFSKRQLAIQRKFIQYLINEQKKSYLKHGYWDLSEMRLSEDVFSKIEKKYSDIFKQIYN